MKGLKRMRTTSERRKWFVAEELMREFPEMKVRAKRNAHNLPNSWDDEIWTKPPRTWKRHRREQYKK